MSSTDYRCGMRTGVTEVRWVGIFEGVLALHVATKERLPPFRLCGLQLLWKVYEVTG